MAFEHIGMSKGHFTPPALAVGWATRWMNFRGLELHPKFLLTAILVLPATGVTESAPPAHALSVMVRETAGIRRGNFPALASVQIAQGQLRDAAHVRLLLEQQEIPVQASGETRWPDGSIRQLGLNFNASIGPLAEQRYRLEFGDRVRPQPVQTDQLSVVESADAWQVGKVRFGREPAALLQSVAFGREIIGSGLNAFTVTAADGRDYPLAGEVAVEIVKPGPLAVQLRYAGSLQLAPDYSAPFTITLDIPNTKSWVRYSATVEDPALRIRAIGLHSSFALGKFPWTWDFGTGSWSYGAFRNTTDSVVLRQIAGARGVTDWQIATGPQGREQLYERAAGRRPARVEGWGHLQDESRAVAFAIEDFGRVPGEHSISLDGNGQLLFRFAPAEPASRHTLSVYEHYVASPVPIGAATSPVAMSSPLVVSVEPGSPAAR